MEPIISVENLSKRYRIGARQAGNSLREALVSTLRAPFRRLRDGGTNSDETIWALKGVSFDVNEGEVIGFVGRNGAGKSTLLKILSRITKPTSGRVRLNGRVGSLLEVGTGFHSELTGRENVFLNGAILGMSKEEIRRKFDEIVAFSEVEKFIDTPVKHYSSGMTVRLAFAVAAHLEPEILIVDEVLAVGDMVFQKKCLGKMDDIARAGRTVLFVSHDLNAVNALCTRAVLLHAGSVVMTGPTKDVTAYYLDRTNKLYTPVTGATFPEAGNDEISVKGVRVTQAGAQTSAVNCREPFTVTVEYENKQAVRGSRLFLLVRNGKGDVIFGTSDYDVLTDAAVNRQPGRFTSAVTIPGGLLKTGTYYGTIGADVKNERVVFAESDILQFDVFEPGDDTLAERHRRPGAIAPLLHWTTTRAEGATDYPNA